MLLPLLLLLPQVQADPVEVVVLAEQFEIGCDEPVTFPIVNIPQGAEAVSFQLSTRGVFVYQFENTTPMTPPFPDPWTVVVGLALHQSGTVQDYISLSARVGPAEVEPAVSLHDPEVWSVAPAFDGKWDWRGPSGFTATIHGDLAVSEYETTDPDEIDLLDGPGDVRIRVVPDCVSAWSVSGSGQWWMLTSFRVVGTVRLAYLSP